MLCRNILIFYGFSTLLLILQTTLAIDLKSDDYFRRTIEKKSNPILSSLQRLRKFKVPEVKNRTNTSVTTDGKHNGVGLTDQRNGSFRMKNIFTQKHMVRDGLVEKYQRNEKNIFGQNGKFLEKARNEGIVWMRSRTPRLESDINGVKILSEPIEWPRNRTKRRAEEKERKKRKQKKKNKEENKEPSISDSFLEMASQTLKDGLRGGVRLWNKLKNQISDGFNNNS